MSSEEVEGRSRRPRLLRGYLPIVVVAVVVIAAVVFVTRNGSDDDGGNTPEVDADEAAVGQTASGWGDSVQACADQENQTDDAYAPPCFEFSGDNGEETAQGVTDDSITITFRSLADGHLIDLVSRFAGGDLLLNETPEDLQRTVEGLVDYFNENYDLYGRELVLETFDGSGSLAAELQNSGEREAANDALRASDVGENGAFADVFSVTQPYAEALSDEGVVNMGVPYMSREWFNEGDRATYAWSNFPDCSLVAEISAEVAVKRLLGETAAFAGDEFADQERRLSVVVPTEEEYQRCLDRAVEIIEEAGFEVETIDYPLDLGRASENAANVLPQLVDADITSVACGCDPLMMQNLVAQADQAGYEPEWLMLGVAFLDWDLVGQMMAKQAPDQWARSFGGTPSAETVPFEESEGYQAYTSVRDDEPSRVVNLLYSQLYRLVVGIHMAGPELTPETFRDGLFNYPSRTGFDGTWDFSPDNHSGITDARFVVWDPNATSAFNGQPGAYASLGERYTDVDEAPTQDELIEQYGDQFGIG